MEILNNNNKKHGVCYCLLMQKDIVLVSIILLFAPMLSFSVLADPLEQRHFVLQDLQRKKKAQSYVPGEVLIKYRNGVSLEGKMNAIESSGSHVFQETRNSRRNLAHVKLRKDLSVDSAIALYAQDADVEYIQPNYIYHASRIPDDTYYNQQWGLKNSGQTISSAQYPLNNPGTVGKDMNLAGAWDQITDCSSITVAVIDTGANYNHEDLMGSMWNGSGVACPSGEMATHGCDWVDNDNDPMDFNGHGTHVAGIIGAIGDNSVGISGVCWKGNIMALRALDSMGSGTTANIVSALDFAVTNGAKVVNMSLGSFNSDTSLNNSITNAQLNDVVVVVAAGNDGFSLDGWLSYPCKYSQDNIVCVAALDQSYSLAGFSNYDANPTVASRTVDVGAPGTNIVSAWFGYDAIVASEDFSSGWTMNPGSNGWTTGSCNLGGISYAMLMDPFDWCNYGKYANSADHRAYKQFDLSSYQNAYMEFYAFINLESNYDKLYIGSSISGGDPFNSGNILDTLTGSTNGHAYYYSYPICNTATCSLGFRMTSDGGINSYGVGILEFKIHSRMPTTSSYQVEDGTSMATPYVAGLAAMLRAYNPGFTYSDTINAITKGGDAEASLAGKTKSGRAVDAWGSLKYIEAPQNFTLTIL